MPHANNKHPPNTKLLPCVPIVSASSALVVSLRLARSAGRWRGREACRRGSLRTACWNRTKHHGFIVLTSLTRDCIYVAWLLPRRKSNYLTVLYCYLYYNYFSMMPEILSAIMFLHYLRGRSSSGGGDRPSPPPFARLCSLPGCKPPLLLHVLRRWTVCPSPSPCRHCLHCPASPAASGNASAAARWRLPPAPGCPRPSCRSFCIIASCVSMPRSSFTSPAYSS